MLYIALAISIPFFVFEVKVAITYYIVETESFHLVHIVGIGILCIELNLYKRVLHFQRYAHFSVVGFRASHFADIGHVFLLGNIIVDGDIFHPLLRRTGEITGTAPVA